MLVVVEISLAMLCIFGNIEDPEARCYPVLIGGSTPKGEFKLEQRMVESKGYGGDVLQFKEDDHEIYAIHRVWLGRPLEKRAERLKNLDPKIRYITKGCINVDPEVYKELVDCCSTANLTIR